MPLTAVNFITKGPVLHADLLQFYNLFTGVMLDQPVTFKNVLTLGGNQGASTVPLKIYGAVGQTGHLLDLYADTGQAQPGFGFGAAGNFGWGPGGASPVDTFLSRVATQNGHATDTAGLLVQPYLEVTGPIQATSHQFPNGTALTSTAPLQLTINQDLLVNRNVILGTDANAPRLHANSSDPASGSFEANRVISAGRLIGDLVSNANYNGAAWAFYDTSKAAILAEVTNTALSIYSSPSGSAPIWTQRCAIDSAGSGTFTGVLVAQGQAVYLNGAATCGIVLSGGNLVYQGGTSPGDHYFWKNNAGSYANIYALGITLQNDLSCRYLHTNDGSNGIVQADVGSLYLRCGANHVVVCDGTGGMSISGNLSVSSVYMQGGHISIQAGPYPGQYIESAGASVRYAVHGAGSIHSFEYGTAGGGGSGGIAACQASAFNVVSARRYKDNLVVLDDCLERVLDPRVEPMSFVLRDRPEVPQIGFVAEDMYAVCPEAVSPHYATGEINAINYGALVSVLWGAVRALNERIETLENAA